MHVPLFTVPSASAATWRGDAPDLTVNRHCVEVAPPDRGGDSPWWPALHLKKGRKLQVITPAQCRALGDEYRDRAMADGRGASDTPPIKLHDADGRLVARVSWNSTVWSVEGHPIPTS